jgi:hypothetical protein
MQSSSSVLAIRGDEVSFIDSIFWSAAPDRDGAPSDALGFVSMRDELSDNLVPGITVTTLR